jgi:exodeoxyribonuclease VII small subunit
MTKTKEIDKLPYELAFQQLQEMVERLDSSDLTLEEALKAFERGQAAASRCSKLLEEANLKLRQIIPDDSGKFIETDWQIDEDK